MRTFRLIETALLAILVCLNFTACSSDTPEPEKNEEGVVTNQKKLVEIIDPNEGYTQRKYFYDDEGKLTMETFNNGSTHIYTWDTNTIIEDADSKRTTFNLKNNLIASLEKIRDYSINEKKFSYTSTNILILG